MHTHTHYTIENRLVHVKMVVEAAEAAGGWEELRRRIPAVLQTFLGDSEWCVACYQVD